MNKTLRSQDEVSWSASIVPRLRALQASFADDPADQRQSYLAEELKQALDQVPAARRAGYLETLAEYFPMWDESAPAPSAPRPRPATVQESPEELVDRLAAFSDQLSETERQALAERLAAAGYGSPTPATQDSASTSELVAIPPELQKRLNIPPGATLDLERVLRLIATLAEFAVILEQLTWNLWKTLAPQSVVRRETGDLRKLAGPYLTGDREVSSTQISQTLEKTRQLIAGLLAAIGTTGETFARQYMSRFSPTAIKEMADAESGFFLGPEQKCWRQYLTLFNDMSGVAIEEEISKIITRQTESLILGRGYDASAPPSGSQET